MTNRQERVPASVGRAALWVASGLLVGRFAGIARELLLAGQFGSTRTADLAVLLIISPDVLVTLVGGGAVGLVLIPIFMACDRAEQGALLRRSTVKLFVLSAAVAACAFGVTFVAGSHWVAAGDIESREFILALALTAMALPFAASATLTSALLRARDQFATASFATAIYAAPILGALLLVPTVTGVAVGILFGAAGRYVSQLAALGPGVITGGANSDTRHFRLRDLVVASAAAVLAAGQLVVPLAVATAFGQTGDVALVSYGWRLLLIPIGLLSSLVTVAAFPTVVGILRVPSGESTASLRRLFEPVIAIATSAGMWTLVVSASISAAVYGSIGLEDGAVDDVTSALRWGALAVPLLVTASSAQSVLFATENRRSAVTTQATSMVVLVIVSSAGFVAGGPGGAMFGVTVYSGLLCVLSYREVLGRAEVKLIDRKFAGRIATHALLAVGCSVIAEVAIGTDGIIAVAMSGLAVLAANGGLLLLHRRVAPKPGAASAADSADQV